MSKFLLEVNDADYKIPITAKELEEALLEVGYGYMKVEPYEEAK